MIYNCKYNWKELNRRDKTSILTSAMMYNIYLRGNNQKIGLREVKVNFDKENDLRIDVLEINRKRNILVGYEIKSCIQDFRTDKKFEKYLNYVNQLYFLFDEETYTKYQDEILNKIENKAGIYLFNPLTKNCFLVKGVNFRELPEKTEEFYRKLLFNHLFKECIKTLNARITL